MNNAEGMEEKDYRNGYFDEHENNHNEWKTKEKKKSNA